MVAPARGHPYTGSNMAHLLQLARAVNRYLENNYCNGAEIVDHGGMIITEDRLRHDLPPMLYDKDGGINFVVALQKPGRYPEITSPWMTTNTAYYCANQEDFVGWMEIEHPGFLPKNPSSQ